MTNKEIDSIPVIKKIEELAAKLEKTRTETAHSINVFNGNVELTIKELKEAKKTTVEEVIRLKDTLTEFTEVKDSLESVVRVLSITPDKLDDRLDEFPKNFNESIKNSIPSLGKLLSEHIDATVASSLKGFEHRIEKIIRDTDASFSSSAESMVAQTGALMMSTNIEIAEALGKLKGGTDQLHADIRHKLDVYTEGFDKIIDRSDRFRMRRLLFTLLICGAFSAVVSAISVWHMITYGIWLK